MGEETVQYLKKHGKKELELWQQQELYQVIYFKKAKKYKIEAIVPKKLNKNILIILYITSKANKPVDMDKFNVVADKLRAKGAENIYTRLQ